MDRMGGILTKGLGASACNSLIYGPFRLKCFVSLVTEAGHGSAPHVRPGSKVEKIVKDRLSEISKSNHIQQIEAELAAARKRADDDTDERNTDLHNKRLIRVVVGYNTSVVEKEFVVQKKRADKIVKAINFINRTTQKININFSKLKKSLADIKVTFKR